MKLILASLVATAFLLSACGGAPPAAHNVSIRNAPDHPAPTVGDP